MYESRTFAPKLYSEIEGEFGEIQFYYDDPRKSVVFCAMAWIQETTP